MSYAIDACATDAALATANLRNGVVVPIPTLPVVSIVTRSELLVRRVNAWLLNDPAKTLPLPKEPNMEKTLLPSFTRSPLPKIVSFSFKPLAPGVVVPMPTLPLPRTVKSEELVVLAMLNSGIDPSCCAAVETASLPHGVVVPTPTLPEKFAAAAVSVPVSVGLAEKTANPEPVSSVSAAARLADDGVPRNVAMPVPKDVMPVPPLDTPSVPVTSDARLTEAQVATYAALMERTN